MRRLFVNFINVNTNSVSLIEQLIINKSYHHFQSSLSPRFFSFSYRLNLVCIYFMPHFSSFVSSLPSHVKCIDLRSSTYISLLTYTCIYHPIEHAIYVHTDRIVDKQRRQRTTTVGLPSLTLYAEIENEKTLIFSSN